MHAVPAVQGTKACLGWDRGGGGSQQAPVTTGTTAVVDLWLQLLLGALQVGVSGWDAVLLLGPFGWAVSRILEGPGASSSHSCWSTGFPHEAVEDGL